MNPRAVFIATIKNGVERNINKKPTSTSTQLYYHPFLVYRTENGKKPILLGLCCWIAISLVSIGVQLATGIFYTNL